MTFLHKLAKRLALIPATLISTLGLLASCSEGTPHEYLGPDPTKPNPAGVYIGLSIVPNDPQVVQGDSVRLQALGWLPSGLSTPIAVTWTAVGGTVSGTGWFRPTSAGSFRVRAVSTSNPALTDSVLVTAIPSGGIARLDITPSAAPLAAGTKQQFTAVALMGDGTRMYPTVIWSATGGTITQSGLFTASGTPGGYTVTATIGGGMLLGLTAGLVDAAALTGLWIDPEALMMESGTVRQFVPHASWSDGSTFVPPLTWTATGGSVTSSGVYTAGNAPGSYRVIASSPLGKADTANVTILPRIMSIRLAPLSALLAFEATQVVTAYALRNDGTEGPVGVSWSAEGGSITLDGTYTAGTTAGIHAVVGTLTALNGSVLSDTAYFEVGANDAAIVQIFVKPDTTVQVGNQVQFSATGVTSTGGSAVPAVTWSATGGSIDSKGTYTAGSVPGNYRVIGKKKNGAQADTANVVVISAPIVTVSAFTISPQTDILGPGQSRQFSATLSWNDAGVHPANISWVSAGGTITQNGLYTAGTVAGTFLVIATCGCGAADTASVTIPPSAAPPVTLSQLVLSPPAVTLDAGSAQIFSVAGVWSDGATSAPGVSFVATGGSISSAGAYIAGSDPGTFHVIATQAGGGLADTSIVTIRAGSGGGATLTQLVLNPSAVTVPKGGTQAFVVSASWSDGSTTVPPVTFAATGGTVSPDGVYTAGTTAGTYRLIVNHTGGTKADTSVVTISAATLNQLVLNPSTVSLAPAGIQQFVVSGSWSDGSSVAPAVTWTAGGGSITPTGLYSAGSTGGTFQVIALQTGGTKADTSTVTIAAAPPPPTGPIEPIAPALLHTAYVAPTGAVITVPAGGDLQAALDAATCGSTITLAAGATWTGNYGLPPKMCSTNPIHVRTSGALPPEGVRVTPATAAGFAKIMSPNVESALRAVGRSKGWRLIALEIGVVPGVAINYGILRIGEGYDTSLETLPGNVVMDRLYVHGNTTGQMKRCIALNGDSTAVIDSWVAECHAGQDAQAAGGWNGSGPFKIVNNYLEATGENIMFGGASAVVPNLTPSDIEIRRNYFFKPLSWIGNASYGIKNLLELKVGKRVLIEGNVFKNNWAHAQAGFAIQLLSTDDLQMSPWSATTDVLMQHNWIESVGSGISVAGEYTLAAGDAGPTARIAIRHNVMVDVGRPDLLAEGKLLQVLGMWTGIRGLTFDHNTFLSSTAPGSMSYWAIGFDGTKNSQFVFTNNLISNGTYGVWSGYAPAGTGALDKHNTAWTFAGNALVDGQSGGVPGGNFFPTLASLGLDANYRLGAGSGLQGKGTDGKDVGANIDAVLQAIAGVRP